MPVLSKVEGTPASQNPKSEYRNPKQTQSVNPNYKIRNGLVWNFLMFDDFEIVSDFEFRICTSFYTWRPLWFDFRSPSGACVEGPPGANRSAFLHESSFPIPNSKFQPKLPNIFG